MKLKELLYRLRMARWYCYYNSTWSKPWRALGDAWRCAVNRWTLENISPHEGAEC